MWGSKLDYQMDLRSDLVVGREWVDDDGDGEGEDEDARDGGEAPDELAEVRSGVEVVADGGEGHQAPPERQDYQQQQGV